MARYVPPVTSVIYRCGVEFHTTKRNWRWEHDEWFPLKCLRSPQAALQCRRIANTAAAKTKLANKVKKPE